jgi:agmatine deiminase
MSHLKLWAINSNKMICDKETNTLYLSDCLQTKQPVFFQRFTSLLEQQGIVPKFIPQTRDIWAVDFMPVQLSEDNFVQFVYNPDYLQAKKWVKTIPDMDLICQEMGINPIKSDIVIDGGNVVKSRSKVILCDKIFKENPHYERKALLRKLYEIFEAEQIILVPQQPHDFTGHADGMIRFLDENTVIVNDSSKEKEYFQRTFKIALDNARLEYIEIPFNPYGNKKYSQANGDYINFLEMENYIFLPVFGLPEDDLVLKQFQQLFPTKKIVPVESNEIADEGGVLNCISWNVKF